MKFNPVYWILSVMGVLALGCVVCLFFAKGEPYSEFVSPDGNYVLEVYAEGFLHVSASDAPGRIVLRRSNGEVIRTGWVEMTQLVEGAEWTQSSVYVKAVLDWDLPDRNRARATESSLDRFPAPFEKP